MNKFSLFFKIISIFFMVLNAITFLGFGTVFVLTLCKVLVINIYYFIAFMVVMGLNVAYVSYLAVVLILNRSK